MITSRSGSQGNASATPPQTIEAVRRRARHRLIGAVLLVLVGVLGFPLLFDTEPRPLAGDIPIEIPSRSDTALVAKARTGGAGDARTDQTDRVPSVPVSAQESLDTREIVVEPSTVVASRAEAPVETAAKAAPKTAVVAEPATKAAGGDASKLKSAQVAAAAKDKSEAVDTARAKALLENKAPAGAERLVVQVGAFSDPVSARATRMKVERAGMTTYTHVAETPSGKLIRVRVGPFGTRAEADKAAARVKALGLPARILAL